MKISDQREGLADERESDAKKLNRLYLLAGRVDRGTTEYSKPKGRRSVDIQQDLDAIDLVWNGNQQDNTTSRRALEDCFAVIDVLWEKIGAALETYSSNRAK